MKKQTIKGLILCLFLVFALAGCSNTSSTTAGKTSDQSKEKQNIKTTTAQKTQNTPEQSGSKQNIGDNKQNPVGNESENAGQQRSKAGLLGQVKSVKGNDVTIAVAEMPSREGGAPPQNPPADQSNKNEQGQREMPSPSLTGENKTITIPAGVKILSGGRENNKEITISDLKEGDMIEVYYQDNDKTVVESVRVMQSPQ